MRDIGPIAPEALRVGRYLAVGGGANIVVLSIYYTATLWLGWAPKLALTVASAPGFLLAYAANRAWTFRSGAAIRSSLIRYTIGYGLSFLLQIACLHLGVNILGLPHQGVVLFGLACATLFFFLLQRFWVFQSPPAIIAIPVEDRS